MLVEIKKEYLRRFDRRPLKFGEVLRDASRRSGRAQALAPWVADTGVIQEYRFSGREASFHGVGFNRAGHQRDRAGVGGKCEASEK